VVPIGAKRANSPRRKLLRIKVIEKTRPKLKNPD
jgi:hypothetical protein